MLPQGGSGAWSTAPAWHRSGVDRTGEEHAGVQGPVGRGERLLAPDLARGIALLGIALANGVVHISGVDVGPLLRPVEAGTTDRLADTVVGLLVDNRAFPAFTMLLAHGYVSVLRRQSAAGVPWERARALLVRRSLWLSAVGTAHLVLLFVGDILLAYGLLGLALVTVVRAEDRALRLVGWATLPVFLGLGALDGLGGSAGSASATYPGGLVERVVVAGSTLLGAPVYVAALAPAAVVGVLLARSRVLEEPVAHLRQLRRVALVGLPISVLGAVPLVLMATQVVQAPLSARLLAAALHGGTGLVGAVAFLAGVSWFTAARHTRLGPGAPRTGVVRLLAAVGERSLTCYLLQSLLLVPLLSPWALGLGEGTGTAPVSVIAVGVFLVTVLVAAALDRAGRRGPAEVVLRRLVYGASAARAG